MNRPLLPLIVAGAIVLAACEHDRPEGAARFIPTADPGRATGDGDGGERPRAPLPIRDGDVIFDVYSVICGRTLGNEQRTFEPEGYFCDIGISVLNEGSAPVRIDPFAQVVVAAGQPRTPWREAMRGIYLGLPNSLFGSPVPPGGGGTANLIFELPDGARPKRLVLHAGPGTPGATVRLTGCGLFEEDTPGECLLERVRAQKGAAFPSRAEVGAPYPATLDFTQGGGVCFARRLWQPADGGTSVAGLAGHGVVSLTGEDAAVFRDNSGAEVALSPTDSDVAAAAGCV